MDQKDTEKNIAALQELRARAMRVTEALYRTTDLFPDAEPLKWSLRDSAVKILNTLSEISEQPSYQELRNTQMLEKMIGALCYKLDLATGGTFIARANFDVLDREYKSLAQKIMQGNFFSLPLLTEQKPTTYQALIESDISDNRTLVVQKSSMVSDGSMGASTAVVETRAETKKVEKREANNHAPQATKSLTSSVGLSGRKDSILKLIKGRGPSSVGDLAPLIDASMSEKTIQRDLNALFEAGLVKKEGEKRWRRYYL